MPPYRLIYWVNRGRAEQVRLLLNELGQEYQDVHVEHGPGLAALRAQGVLPFGSVPVLEEGDFRLAQAPVILSYLARKHGIAPSDPQAAALADSIAWGAEDLRTHYFKLFGEEGAQRQAEFVRGPWRERWLPAFTALLERNGGGTFVGPAVTHADLAVWDALDACLQWVEGARLDGFPRLAAFQDAIAARPRIAAYLRSDRRAQG
jgi:glutathione S-transferase